MPIFSEEVKQEEKTGVKQEEKTGVKQEEKDWLGEIDSLKKAYEDKLNALNLELTKIKNELVEVYKKGLDEEEPSTLFELARKIKERI